MNRGTGYVACLLILIAWGALAFGAVYPWAYWPLAACATVIGVYGLVLDRHVRAMPLPPGLLIAFAVPLVAMLLQLVPLRHDTIAAWSPNTTHVLENYDMLYTVDASRRHALSIHPQLTMVTAALYVALVLFLAGTSRALSLVGSTRLAAGIVALGLLLTVVGFVQKSLDTRLIYGFWKPYGYAVAFGPFVNRNHYAGWMAMTLPVSLGYFCGRAAHVMPGAMSGFHPRRLSRSSEAVSQLVLVGFAICAMAIAMVLTFSLAGILCLAFAVCATVATVSLRQRGATRMVLGAYLLTIVVVAIGLGSFDLVAERFAAANWRQVNGRLGAWNDAWDIARRFPIFGSGMNTYGITTIFYQTYDLTVHYEQAHNDYLQVLAEGGLLVAVPAAAVLILFVAEIRRRFADTESGTMTYWIRVGAVTGLIAIAVQETVDFSLQMPGNAILFAVLVAIAVHRPAGAEVRRSRQSRVSRSLRVSAC